MSGEERFIFVAQAFEGFQFACTVDLTVLVPADIQRDDTDGIAGNEEFVTFLIVEGEGENAALPFDDTYGE